MITIENKTSGASFRYEDDKFMMSGNYLVNAEDKSFINLNINISKADGAYKGNAYLQEGELMYNFASVKPAEIAEIVEHCEMCFAELQGAI